jgi:hypothetical protein
VKTLYTLIIGFVGGIVGALGSDFLRAPVRQFFTLRTEIRHEMLRLANVAPPDPRWTYPTYSQDDLGRLLGPIREAQRTLRTLGTRMQAFGETEWVAAKCVQLLRFKPLDAAEGLIDLSNSFSEYGNEPAVHRTRINKALRFPD